MDGPPISSWKGSSILTGPKPKTGVFMEANGSPTVFQNPLQTISCSCSPGSANGLQTFRSTYAGEAGQRNNFRGPGYFGVDAGLSKMWNVGEQKAVRFAWEVFNVTNSVRFDAAGSLIGQTLVNNTGFGIFNTELTSPRVMQYSAPILLLGSPHDQKGTASPSFFGNRWESFSRDRRR
jgi:hypothetical protein